MQCPGYVTQVASHNPATAASNATKAPLAYTFTVHKDKVNEAILVVNVAQGLRTYTHTQKKIEYAHNMQTMNLHTICTHTMIHTNALTVC